MYKFSKHLSINDEIKPTISGLALNKFGIAFPLRYETCQLRTEEEGLRFNQAVLVHNNTTSYHHKQNQELVETCVGLFFAYKIIA